MLIEEIQPACNLLEPNQVVNIYSGKGKIYSGTESVDCDINITYKWFPQMQAHFHAIIYDSPQKIMIAAMSSNECNIEIKDIMIGKIKIKEAVLTAEEHSEFYGTIDNETILGNTNIEVDRIDFSVCNLRNLNGSWYQIGEGQDAIISGGYIEFPFKNLTIKIVRKLNYFEKIKSLKNKGGYNTTYDGRIESSGAKISLNDYKSLCDAFETFISFVNASKTAPHFAAGYYKNNLIWSDYTTRRNSAYKERYSWVPEFASNNHITLPVAWKKFVTLWNNTNDQDFLTRSIHWYLEANDTAGDLDGAIVMAQTCIEMIYNYLIVEKEKIVLGRDSESISASNKIRLLLTFIRADKSIPTTCSAMIQHAKANNIEDGPECIVQIRNALVHSHTEKRKKINKIQQSTMLQALHLALWYIEISLLFILEYPGEHMNRTKEVESFNKGGLPLPWQMLKQS